MPNPVTALGRYLSKRKDKKNDGKVVSPERARLLERVEIMRRLAGQMELPGLQGLIIGGLDTVVQKEAGLDALPDANTRSALLLQLIGAVESLQARLDDADAPAKNVNTLKGLIQKHRKTVAGLKDATVRGRLETSLATFERGIATIISKPDPKELAALEKLVTTVRDMQGEIDEALSAQRIDDARLKVEADLPGLRLRMAAVRQLDASAPAAKSGLLVIAGLESRIGSATTAGDHLEAMAQLQPLAVELLEAERREGREAKAYVDALAAAGKMHEALSHGVVKDESAAFATDYIAEPARLHAAGDRHRAIAGLSLATQQYLKVAALLKDYIDKLAAAREQLKNAKPRMLEPDVVKVDESMIAAAEAKAKAGERQAALDLLAKVAPHCALSVRANLKSFTLADGWGGDSIAGPLEALSKHAAKKEFATEIAALQARLDRLRQIVADNMTNRKVKDNKTNSSFADNEAVQIYFAAERQREFADSHAAYDTERKAVEGRVETLKTSAPTGSNSALVDELKAIQDGLDKAGRQAAKRTYDLSMSTLKTVDEAVAAAVELKAAHAGWVAALASLEPRAMNTGDWPDTPSAAEAEALRNLLGQAKALAEKRDFKGANELMARLLVDCDAYEVFERNTLADWEATNAALAELGTDPGTALADVRKLLEALKKRAGHEGITRQIGLVEGLIEQAATALKA